MSLQDYVSVDRICFLEPDLDRNDALKRLIDLVCRDNAAFDCREVTHRVFEREASLSSSLGGGIALPHAVLDHTGESLIAVGVSKNGIQWDADSAGNVHLVILLVGGRIDHLHLLGEIASKIRDKSRFDRIVAAGSEAEIVQHFVDKKLPRAERHGKLDADVSRLTFERARSLAEELDHGRLVLHADAIDNPDYILELVADSDALVLTNSDSKFAADYRDRLDVITIPFKGIRRSTHVQFALLFLLSLGRIRREDIIVNVYGVPESGHLDSIRLTHIGSELEFPMDLQSGRIPTDVTEHVLTRVLQIAGELAAEGREGKAIGTLFVLGDFETVRDYARQLIMNPFYGYDQIDRNILDPSLEETIKEYAKIDGAFIIRGNGVIESGGTFLIGQPAPEEHQSGLGARHAAALGISAVSDAIAITVSESTRKISIFHGGRRIIFM